VRVREGVCVCACVIFQTHITEELQQGLDTCEVYVCVCVCVYVC